MSGRRCLAAALALAWGLAACAGPGGGPASPRASVGVKASRPPGGTPRPGATPTPPGPAGVDGGTALRVVAPTGGVATFVGKVRLVPALDPATLASYPEAVIDRAGRILSNNGGNIVSDNGGGIISDQGGSFVGKVRGDGAGLIGKTRDDGAGLVGKTRDEGTGFVGKVRYGLRQAATPARAEAARELPLVGAEVLVFDAAGRQLAGADGRPIAAVTDGAGGYRLSAALPAEPLVLAVRLWNGGELLALLPEPGTGEQALAIDTASSLAGGLVLDRYVGDDAAKLARLPQPAADRLRRDLEAARGLDRRPPIYLASTLAAQAEALRRLDPELDETVTQIEKLFLGQANLGDGEAATAVSLGDPTRVLAEPDGGFLVAERLFGRLRRVGPDGRMTVLADEATGRIRRNFPWIAGLARAADGAVLVSHLGEPRVLRLGADGAVTTAAELAGFRPGPLAVGVGGESDGTIYAAEADGQAAGRADAPRIVAFAPGAAPRDVAPAGAIAGHDVLAVARADDGALWTYVRRKGEDSRLMRLAPGAAAWTEIARPPGSSFFGDLLPDGGGAVIVCEAGPSRVSRYGPDGVRTTLAEGAPLVRPAGVARLADGRLVVADTGAAIVVALDPAGGPPRVVAGLAPGQAEVRADRIALNAPGALAVGADGLYLVDGASNAVKRFADGVLTTVAGGLLGFSDDGVPAAEARLSIVSALATRDGTTWLAERGSKRLRSVGPDGVLRTGAGHAPVRGKFKQVGGLRPATDVNVENVLGLAIDPQGRPVWVTALQHQVRRLEADGQVRLLAGDPRQNEGDAADGPLAGAAFRGPCGLAFGPDGALYVADTFNFQIRRIGGLDGPNPTIEAFAGVPRAEAIARATGAAPASDEGRDRRDASFWLPAVLCFDAAGNLYVTEPGTSDPAMLTAVLDNPLTADLATLPPQRARVRKIAPDGRVTTIAGVGGRHFAAEAGAEALGFPAGLAIDAAGRLAISDLTQNLVRFVPAAER